MNKTKNTNLKLLQKQQYYVHLCHKLCEGCLDGPPVCPVCDTNKDTIIEKYRTWVFNFSLCQGIIIKSLEDFHNVYNKLLVFLANKSKDGSPMTILNCKFETNSIHEKQILQKNWYKKEYGSNDFWILRASSGRLSKRIPTPPPPGNSQSVPSLAE